MESTLSAFPFFLYSHIIQGNYSIEGEAGEPDPHVLDLNAELNEIDALAANSLSDDARRSDLKIIACAR